MTNIREMKPSDLICIKSIIDDTQMFPSMLLDDMTQSYFKQESGDQWFVVENHPDGVVAVAYCSPEQMTDGTWNLLLIAVLQKHQGTGIGTRLIQFLENKLMQQCARLLLVETSGLPEFELTRHFYPQCGFKQVALIPEYYAAGDDKVVFWKSITQSTLSEATNVNNSQ